MVKIYEHKTVKLKSLKPYAKNARTHSEQQLHQLAASISEFGFTNPILIDPRNSIIAGHGRLEAAKKLGIQEVPAIIIKGLTAPKILPQKYRKK